jgi:hypothetical protein
MFLFLASSKPYEACYPKLKPVFSRGVKQQARKADHSLPSTAEAKKNVAVTPLPNTSSYSVMLN